MSQRPSKRPRLQASDDSVSEDIALRERLLRQSVDIFQGTVFDDGAIERFHNALRNQSKSRLLTTYARFLVPSVEKQDLGEVSVLEDAIVVYNEKWLNVAPIYGPNPRPVVNMKNMHSMCIAMRAVWSLTSISNSMERIHRRILGFSISYDSERLQIYGHYPEIDDFDGILTANFSLFQEKGYGFTGKDLGTDRSLSYADKEVDKKTQEESIASQDLSESQNMFQTLQRQSDDREARYTKYLTASEQEIIGNTSRQKELLAER
ncbi:hypothetical protein TSTA_033680 [Talaromyces stipitatus ATCC 10500]|uniref:DUF7924 domain-containing protein n=1 Tax=Talaromyces stipitatus (strain ATCC 10500 / CBS 375.48 / QM 6759 / NRRL 1006) TaxID=441959 RepID=B8M5Z9_TALSN|nr:uncharacterized protein TSTA_033680 [Talaromyces stipitatus ATCC 10500]EED20126.1 hypothetical protein TSTA_033680 [Talaromyces stipitatus ATCC 10500]